jgi:small subunit ribosomal protein S1
MANVHVASILGRWIVKQVGVGKKTSVSEKVDESWWNWILQNEDGIRSINEDIPIEFLSENDQDTIDWEFAGRVFEQDEIVEMTVYGFNQGGLLVHNENLQGFVPVSHLLEQPKSQDSETKKKIFNTYVGKILPLKVIECVREEQRIVLSERAALTGNGIRKRLVSSLKKDQIVEGKVTNVTDFGVFVDLGGVEGLVHVSELSWGRVTDPKQFARLGEKIHAIVLQVDQANARIALSVKRLLPNPWEMIKDRYSIGDVIEARVSSIARYGIFMKLDEGIEGLVHISSLKKQSDKKSIRTRFKINQPQRVRILNIDADHKRLGLVLEEDE